MPAFPNFLVVGAMKAGTYSLHHYLHSHPQIEMSQKRKEVNFFVEELSWHRGTDWYRDFWIGNTPMRGESSTRYSMRDRYPGVPARIRSLLPEVRLVYAVRDPIARLMSQYVHDYDDNQEHRRFEDLLLAPDRQLTLSIGCYHYQLQRYLECFPASAIRVVCFEDLIADADRTLKPVLEFLGVDPEFGHSDWGAVHNDSGDKCRETPAGRVVRKLIGRRRLRRTPLLRKTLTRPIPTPVFDAQRHADIVGMYRADAERLETFTGRSFRHWTSLWPQPGTG
ncbi:MAG: sulfotransferase [Hydrocarboniphaga sp.]|uniref:sulfotransferase family protein n=1 Tax=Hydrocarboniphaga sp. TaxID=2033016 RepID=UPI00262ED765|nr:sulfotransferase [Hydrocarboniphaga sp.]MDB5969468.1 sulfotransferase [Hydrocarboniphaga sp.]